jgi:hypothetical protein
MVITGITSNLPEFTVSNPTVPALPITVPAGTSVEIESICYTSAVVGVNNGELTITSDATDAAGNKVTLRGETTTSVEDEMGKTARVWFDVANEQIVFTTVRVNTPVLVHDINGRVLASSMVSDAGSFPVNTSSWNNGVVVITYSDENGQRTRTLSIVR